MKLTTLFISLIWALTSAGQSLTEIKQLLGDKDFIAFKKYFDSGSLRYAKVNPNSNIRAIWELERDLTPMFQEGVVDIDESFPDTDKPGVSTVTSYRINLIATKTVIVYYDFSEKFYTAPYRESFGLRVTDSFRNGIMIDSLRKTFIRIYKKKMDKDELFMDTVVYGFKCYEDASKPFMREQLDRLIKTKNTKILNSWLRSPNTEKQVYAIDGFLQLKRKGLKLTPEQLSVIQSVKNKKGYVNICIGCIHTNGDIGFIVKQILAGRTF